MSGDLTVGGSFQLEGNAGGDVLACEPPDRFRVTFGGPTSVVEVRLRPGDEPGSTVLEVLLEQDPPVRATPGQDAELGRLTVPAWAEAVRVSGTATAEEVEETRAVAAAQYAPEPTA